jgi:hypothetical protein
MDKSRINSERLYFLIKISTTKFKNPIAIQDLIKLIGIKRANFTFIKNVLINNGIATEKQLVGNSKFLSIDTTKLDKFIKETSIYIMVAGYIINKDPLLHQP